MPVTAEDVQSLILLEIGDVDPATGDPPTTPSDGIVYQQIGLLWDQYAVKDLVVPGLRALYVKRAALQMILQVLAPRRFDSADVLAGLTFKVGQVWDHYWDLYGCVKGEIEVVEKKFASSRVVRAGRLTTRAPYTPAHPPDANWPRYGGTPYVRRVRRRSS